MDIVKTITSRDNARRVEIHRRSNGTYGFYEYIWDSEDKAWIQHGHYSHSFVDSPERAEAEARARVDWLIAEGADD